MTTFKIATGIVVPAHQPPMRIAATVLDGLILLAHRLPTSSMWGETFTLGEQKFASIAHLYYCPARLMFAYDGTCFGPDGHPVSWWSTLTSAYDARDRILHYTYRARECPAKADTHGGVGQLTMVPGYRKVSPVSGSFGTSTSAWIDHKMHPLPDHVRAMPPMAQLKELTLVLRKERSLRTDLRHAA